MLLKPETDGVNRLTLAVLLAQVGDKLMHIHSVRLKAYGAGAQ